VDGEKGIGKFGFKAKIEDKDRTITVEFVEAKG